MTLSRLSIGLALAFALMGPQQFALAQDMKTITVDISGFKFKPETIHVRVGDILQFVNRDVVPHQVSQSPRGWSSEGIAAGKSWSLTADKAGTFDYFCKFHPNMKARFVVE